MFFSLFSLIFVKFLLLHILSKQIFYLFVLLFFIPLIYLLILFIFIFIFSFSFWKSRSPIYQVNFFHLVWENDTDCDTGGDDRCTQECHIRNYEPIPGNGNSTDEGLQSHTATSPISRIVQKTLIFYLFLVVNEVSFFLVKILC